jgi:spore coat polysaccharide biosynthesis predicted glycosyltransferase SpsG
MIVYMIKKKDRKIIWIDDIDDPGHQDSLFVINGLISDNNDNIMTYCSAINFF